MYVIKRDGRMVDYDRNKIMLAIRKANAVVGKEEALPEKQSFLRQKLLEDDDEDDEDDDFDDEDDDFLSIKKKK